MSEVAVLLLCCLSSLHVLLRTDMKDNLYEGVKGGDSLTGRGEGLLDRYHDGP